MRQVSRLPGGELALAGLKEEKAQLQLQRKELSLLSRDTAETTAALGPFVTGLQYATGAALALAAGVAALTFETLKFAGAQTEAKNESIRLFDALGDDSRGAGVRTLAVIDDLSARIPETRKELTGWARSLEAIGITDLGELRGQLQAMASAQALAGESGADAYEKLTRKVRTFAELGQALKLPVRGLGSLAETGVHVDEVAREMGVSAKQLGVELKAGTADAKRFGDALEAAVLKKGAGPLAAMGVQLSTVLVKGEEGFKRLFDSIDFLPLSSALHNFFAAFDEGPEHGNILKKGITGALNDIVTGLADFGEKAEFVFLSVELAALRNKPALDAMWKLAKLDGYLFLDVVEKIARSLELSIGMASRLAGGLNAAKNAVESTIGIDTAHALTPDEAQARGVGHANGGRRSPTSVVRDQAHATGGVVGAPAPGEYFASVAPGERIVPRDAPSNDNAGGGVTIQHLELHVTAPHGVTHANEVSASSLAIALERLQLSQGR